MKGSWEEDLSFGRPALPESLSGGGRPKSIDMIYLQRHGESETNLTKTFTCRRLDPGLTEPGRRQIENLIPTRYPEELARVLQDYTESVAKEILAKGKEVVAWIKRQL